MDTRGKETAAAVHEEIAREADQWLRVLFNGRRKTGHVDLEAIETTMRPAMHRAGAVGIAEVLRFPVRPAGQRTAVCRHNRSRASAGAKLGATSGAAQPSQESTECARVRVCGETAAQMALPAQRGTMLNPLRLRSSKRSDDAAHQLPAEKTVPPSRTAWARSGARSECACRPEIAAYPFLGSNVGRARIRGLRWA